MRLDPTAVAAGFRLEAYDVLGSTNAEALANARGGDEGLLWVVAREQNAGRGRRGREWISAPGNLYATLLLSDPAPVESAPQLAFVAGLAVYDAILECARDLAEGLALKWPNDVLYANRKLAGILIESEMTAGKLAVAAGIGVNCARHPAQTSFPATDLTAAGGKVAPESLLRVLSLTMMRRLDRWKRGAGFAAIRADWLGCATGLGRDITVRLPGRELLGRFEGLDEAGHLLLRSADGRLQTITGGEIFPVAERASAGVDFPQRPRQEERGD
ncbi:MAG TPA: biotin--[acetyl-CoA-carboxylase] ligase [Xanthobacteraceae bacterium]|nr:biotin--[acetyl-CoA-carboxylase] ligase [Xanthobacteraceae bacterium]